MGQEGSSNQQNKLGTLSKQKTKAIKRERLKKGGIGK